MSLLMQLQFQPVAKYVRPYGTVLNYIVIPQASDRFIHTSRAKCTSIYTRLVCVSSAYNLLVTSIVTLHGRFRRHQSPVRSRARSEYFYAHAVRVQLHTRAFLKFKSSCTVCTHIRI